MTQPRYPCVTIDVPEGDADEAGALLFELGAEGVEHRDATTLARGAAGKVTIVEFYDYNCAYCRHAIQDMRNLTAADPDLRFVLKEFPILGPDSQKAHVVSMAFHKLMPEKYGEFHNRLLGGQGRAGEASAIKVALSLGADEARLREVMKDPAIQAAEVRQMLEAKAARREERGEPALDVEAESARLLAAAAEHGPPAPDDELRDEVRQLVVARNERRRRAGLEPLDVAAETERQLAELGG